jgi:hypothetical protein
MNEHAESARLPDAVVTRLRRQRSKVIDEYRPKWFVRVFRPTLVALLKEPTVIPTFFYFCARLLHLSEPKRPVDWIQATRHEIAEAIRPEKTRKGPKRRAKDPEQTVTNHLTTSIKLGLLERHPEDMTRYRIPAKAAQFGDVERLAAPVKYIAVLGLFLKGMETHWLRRPHALRVVTVLLRRMVDRPGKGHNWYSATE